MFRKVKKHKSKKHDNKEEERKRDEEDTEAHGIIRRINIQFIKHSIY